MKRKGIISVLLAGVFITAMIVFYKYDTGKKQEILQELSKEFPAVTIDQSLKGLVKDIYHPSPEVFNDDPLQAYILLNDSSKRRIKTGYELSTEIILDSILNVGDYLVKDYGSDMIYLYKTQGSDTTKYIFQLRDDLGYPLKKR